MSRSQAIDAPEELLARIVALITGKPSMARVSGEIRKSSRRVIPRRRAPVRVSREVYERYQKHAEENLCVCGCGEPSASNARGRTVKCYELFRSDKIVKANLVRKESLAKGMSEKVANIKASEAADEFDELMQLEGRIFMPNFNPKRSFEDYDIGAAWEAKRRNVGLAG